MRDLRELDQFRDMNPPVPGSWPGDGTCGRFFIPSPVDGDRICVVASATVYPWDHVSVSRRKRCPTWGEMEHIKRLFFRDHETAMQLHVPPAEHINNHPFCLHLWRPHEVDIPRPPSIMVGLQGAAVRP